MPDDSKDGAGMTAEELENVDREAERAAFLAKKAAKAKAARGKGGNSNAGGNSVTAARKRGGWRLEQVALCSVAVITAVILLLISRSQDTPAKKMYTATQLASYNGKFGRARYLAIVGQVYDVSKGKRFYGDGGGYAHFVGRDASRAFITGDFKGDLNDDVDDFDNEQMAALGEWSNFYHREYTYKGRVVGAFYTKEGHPTPLLHKVRTGAKAAKTQEELIRESEAKHPRCNVRWSDSDGGHVACTGEGLRPRKIFVQLPGGKPTTRCACMPGDGWSDVRQVYPDCSPSAQSCRTAPPASVQESRMADRNAGPAGPEDTEHVKPEAEQEL